MFQAVKFKTTINCRGGGRASQGLGLAVVGKNNIVALTLSEELPGFLVVECSDKAKSSTVRPTLVPLSNVSYLDPPDMPLATKADKPKGGRKKASESDSVAE